ncbi:glycosyltransferase family 39 protein [Arthrobacter sp. B6]|uniref:glycosyltransferase family 39 protein n=1 Tax=Arthrobacter sp. B6 TaxID=1570137 RepID=UPI000A40EEDD|nr:glycosyltransferase family 39 protein [Arthrobacter sp. B6]
MLNQPPDAQELQQRDRVAQPEERPMQLSGVRWTGPARVGLLAFCVAFVGLWIPSFWDDEIATISAVDRSPAQLLVLLQSVDAVHGLYYFMMHAWTSVFGFSEIALRTPSALAVGLACAGTVVIGRKLGSTALGVSSGLVLAVLPRMVWAGTEARQSAFTALLAVILTLLLLRAWKSNRVLDWVLYALCAVIGVWTFMFFVLAVAAHAFAAILLRRRPIATAAACAAVGAGVLPFLLFAMGQKAQVSWIENRSLAQTLSTAAVKQFFYGEDRPTGNLPPQWILAFVALLGVVEVGLVVWGLWTSRRMQQARTLLVLCLTGVVLPIAGLVLVSVVAQPVYVARYLTFTAPAFALLVGLGIVSIPARRAWLRYAAVAVVVAVSLVPQLTLKSLVNEPPDTERKIGDHVAADANAPAAMVFEHAYLRDMTLAYPDDFRNVQDLSLAVSPAESGTLWGENAAVTPAQLSGKGNVWFIGDASDAPDDLSAFASAGCTETQSLMYARMHIVAFACS